VYDIGTLFKELDMSKKMGLFSLITGIAAGAAAVFLSDEKNRQKAETTLKDASVAAKKISKEIKNNPEKAVADLKKTGKKIVKKALSTKTKTSVSKSKAAPKKKKLASKKAK
jgi:hypothetical protein